MQEKKTINIEIGKRIKRQREGAGLTQEVFAEMIGLGVKHVSAIERGAVGVSVPTVQTICRVLSIPTDAVLLDSEPTNDVSALATRLERLPEKQYKIVEKYVSKEIGYSRMSIYTWRRKYLKYGMVGLVAKRKSIPRVPLPQEHALSETEELEKLRTQLQELQFEVDVMKETIAVLKKDPGVDLTVLRNREKAVIIDALKGKYTLPMLLSHFNMAKSSYYYQRAVMNKPDKYVSCRAQITSIFQENRGVYGYRRIYLALKHEGVILSEKIIRRIMKEEELIVLLSKKRKYSSYLGEITPEAENIVSRDFHANQPYEKLLTDITEFAIPNGKLYLSAMIDCFDGKVAGWTTRTRPNADLVNSMLDQVIANLPEGCHPVVHSDRGCHYRWPGWIERMNRAGLIRSMSKKGCSPDNAACEGFFGRLKNEMFYGRSWIGRSLDDFARELDDYINWYNRKRIKLSLGGLSPIEYRQHLGCAV